jgi:hypothetical protein
VIVDGVTSKPGIGQVVAIRDPAGKGSQMFIKAATFMRKMGQGPSRADQGLAAMTIDELAKRLESLGFLCDVDRFEEGETRLIVNKLHSTPGNHIRGNIAMYYPDGHDRSGRPRGPGVELNATGPVVWFRPDGIQFFVCVTIGGRSPGAYEKTFREPDEVYEELLHYFFDADSPMRLENDFVPGPGRPPGA